MAMGAPNQGIRKPTTFEGQKDNVLGFKAI